MTRPTIRLRPKADARRLRHGHPWAFADDLVLDRRTKAVPPGTLCILEDSERRPLGVAAFNPSSRIAARMLDRDPDATIDAAWLAARVTAAQSLRAPLYDTPHHRLIHAEADGLPGVVADRFGDTVVLQPNAAWAEALLPELASAIARVAGATTILKSATGRARAAEGLDDASAVLLGTPPDAPVDVPMNGATYRADLLGGQKTGLFYDQRPNHAFAARLSRGGRVLDVFSHVGGFALAGLAAGAAHATCVDGSAAALALAEEGARATAVADRFATTKADAFDAMEALAGERFDHVIADPPAFAPAKPALEKGLRAYERVARLAAALVADEGWLTLCSCSHAADLPRFHAACARGIGRAGRRAVLVRTGFAGPDHPVHPHLAETGYLKALTFRVA